MTLDIIGNDKTCVPDRSRCLGLRYLEKITMAVVIITVNTENHPVTPLVIVVEFANNSLM